MSISIQKGEKIDILKIVKEINEIYIIIDYKVDNEGEYDIDGAAFILSTNGKVKSEKDFIFYNNPVGGNGSIRHSRNISSSNSGKERISIKLSSVPIDIDKVSFTITIHDAEKRRQNFGNVNYVSIKVFNAQNDEELIRYDMSGYLTVETAIVAAELYRRNGSWKFGAVGSGFVGGLAALCHKFGVEVLEKDMNNPKSINRDEYSTKRKEEKIFPKVETHGNRSGETKINKSKIELKKKGDTVKLEKKSGQTLGDIVVNLNWNQQKIKTSGLLGGLVSAQKIDLDLGCLFELKNGRKGVVQALGNAFGSYTTPPYIFLDKDDRSGSVVEGENLMINGKFLSKMKRILIFAYIYKGVSNWEQVDGVVTIKQKDSSEIVVPLDDDRRNKRMCGIAMVTNENDVAFKIERVVQYYSGHVELDRAYRWNMKWTLGSK
ncbi:TerD family protein [Clostridium lundense]|uniref:TerD family protein n=1 Tax=Clostridium lundense TaxID=319475 RepID=UPI000483D01C|nr:TerD family protein [Clostridium lundense]